MFRVSGLATLTGLSGGDDQLLGQLLPRETNSQHDSDHS